MKIQPIRSVAAGLLLVTVLAACSGTAAAPSGVATLASQAPAAEGSAEPSGSLDPETAQLEFAKCMREHGIDMPDPSTDGKGGIMFRSNNGSAGGDSSGKSFSDGINPESEEFQAAQEACSPILGSMGPDGGPKVESGPGPAKP